MIFRAKLVSDKRGAAAVEMAFALPIMIVMIWAFVQLAQIYRAMAGIQQALGEGARYATLCLTPTSSGCIIPSGSALNDKIRAAVYGIGPGTFKVNPDASGNDSIPALQTDTNGGKYYDLKVTYTQPTDLLMFAGPTISVSRSKRVWVATT
jgi:Flp pilus assembly protein TadG